MVMKKGPVEKKPPKPPTGPPAKKPNEKKNEKQSRKTNGDGGWFGLCTDWVLGRESLHGRNDNLI